MPDDEGNVQADPEALPDTPLHRHSHQHEADSKTDENVDEEEKGPEQ